MIDSSIKTSVVGDWSSPRRTKRFKFVSVVGDRRSAAAHREAGPDQAGQSDFFQHVAGFFDGVDRFTQADFQADFVHRLLKTFAIFGFVDHVGFGTDHFDAIFFQHAVVGKIHGQVQRRLPTQGRQQGIRFFFGDDLFDDSASPAARCRFDPPCPDRS